MRVDCKHCEHKATVTHRKKISEGFTELYADCQNPSCYARTVVHLAYSRTITPPCNDAFSLLTGLINSMKPEEKEKLLSSIS